MKKLILILTFLAFSICTYSIKCTYSADKLINTKVEMVSIQISKNGNEYARALIKEPRTLSGIAYESSVPVMFFGESVKVAKTLKPGDTIKAIVSVREWNGSPSYTIVQVVK